MKITKTEIVNMIMIENKSTGKVLVLDRRGSWAGLTFPGGHVEKGEPFYSYSELHATEMTVENAIKLVDKLSYKYLFKIHRNKKEKEKQIKAHYILC